MTGVVPVYHPAGGAMVFLSGQVTDGESGPVIRVLSGRDICYIIFDRSLADEQLLRDFEC